MEPRTEPPTCHLLRLPYELLKPILAKLSKQDQISTAKTCVILWELAYPMAYNRITVTIRPGLRDSAWQHLASGVGLRYVQHLTISSSCDDTEKGRRLKDLVTGTLIAALRRNQLLSFTSTPPTTWKGSISMKYVVSLIETQGRLQTLSLSGFEGSSSIRLRDYFQPRQVFSRIHELTVNVSYDQTYDGEIYEIVKKSPNLQDLYIRFSQDAADTVPQGYPKDLNASLSRQRLHSMVTRLTLQCMVFCGSQNDLCFQALRALAVVDCNNENHFFYDLNPTQFPHLNALMVKTQGEVSTSPLVSFIRGLKGLRELIVHGKDVWFGEGSYLTQHRESLQLLSLKSSDNHGCFLYDTNPKGDAFDTLAALRHLNLFITDVLGDYPDTIDRDKDSSYDQWLDVIAGYSKLQTLGLHCTLYFGHVPWNQDDQEGNQNNRATFCERAVGRDAITRLSGGLNTQIGAGHLEYLSVKAACDLLVGISCFGSDFHRDEFTSLEKHMFSLKPQIAFEEAIKLKQEMLDRYSGDDYCFFEDYIDGMMEKSEVRFIDYHDFSSSSGAE